MENAFVCIAVKETFEESAFFYTGQLAPFGTHCSGRHCREGHRQIIQIGKLISELRRNFSSAYHILYMAFLFSAEEHTMNGFFSFGLRSHALAMQVMNKSLAVMYGRNM